MTILYMLYVVVSMASSTGSQQDKFLVVQQSVLRETEMKKGQEVNLKVTNKPQSFLINPPKYYLLYVEA